MFFSLAILVTHQVVYGDQVCYGNLGCFSNAPPFQGLSRPLSPLPAAPDVIGTKFYLYTRSNPSMALRERLIADSPGTFSASHFSAARRSRMVIHGFSQSAQETWVQTMVDELLKKEDANVITVDWSQGGNLVVSYTQSVANSRVVGAEAAKLIDHLSTAYGLSGQNFHIIGLGVGAHIAGYAGDILGNLGRITGLDAAAQQFDGMEPVVRLDATDAMFVDVIHTDGSPFIDDILGVGTSNAIGHVDFYPNNGMYQPGCHDNSVTTVIATGFGMLSGGHDGAEEALACSHMKAVDFFTESVNSSCPFTAYPCESYDKFINGLCLYCGGGRCSQMGYHAMDHYGARGTMYLMTTDGANGKSCAYHYNVQVKSSNPMPQAVGRLYVTLHGCLGNTGPMEITNGYGVSLSQGETYQKTLIVPEDIGVIKSVDVRFERSFSLWNIFSSQSYSVRTVTITAGETQTSYGLSAGDTSINSGGYLSLPTAVGPC